MPNVWLKALLKTYLSFFIRTWFSFQWRHNGRDGVPNHQPHHRLLNRLFSADQRKHQSSASLAFSWGIRRWPVNSLHKWPVTREIFPFDDVIMYWNIHPNWKWFFFNFKTPRSFLKSKPVPLKPKKDPPKPVIPPSLSTELLGSTMATLISTAT